MAAEHVRALGERIRLRREELGLTQDEVARQMKGSVDGQRISKWERGENRPRDESLEDLARVLQTTPFELLLPAPNGKPTPDLSLVQPQDAVMDRLDAIDERLGRIERLLGERTIDPAAIEATRVLLREALERRADPAVAASRP